MYQDRPTTDLPELSQDLVQLEKAVRRIFASRIVSTIFTTTIMFGISVYLALTPTITSNSIPYAFVWILYAIGIITAIELILEIIAAYYRPRWYGYVNFFVWNIIGQIGLLTSRQATSGRQNSLFSSFISLNPKRVIEDTYELYREKERLKTRASFFNKSFIIDRYLTLKYQPKISTHTPDLS